MTNTNRKDVVRLFPASAAPLVRARPGVRGLGVPPVLQPAGFRLPLQNRSGRPHVSSPGTGRLRFPPRIRTGRLCRSTERPGRKALLPADQGLQEKKQQVGPVGVCPRRGPWRGGKERFLLSFRRARLPVCPRRSEAEGAARYTGAHFRAAVHARWTGQPPAPPRKMEETRHFIM